MAQIVTTLVDVGGEKTTFTANVADPIGADTWTILLAVMTGLETAIGNFSRGYLESIFYRAGGVENAPDVASDVEAQRELAARFFYHEDVTNKKGFLSIGMPDLANVDILALTDLLDLTDTEAAAVVTWIEANVELNGQSVTVDRAVLVGRST